MAQELEAVTYRITIGGQLDEPWAGWFESLTISHDEDGNTVLAGPIADQAALRGILAKSVKAVGCSIRGCRLCATLRTGTMLSLSPYAGTLVPCLHVSSDSKGSI